MKAGQGRRQEDREATRAGRGRATATPAEADGRAEFKEMFVSLVDPAGVLDMERCGRMAALMREAASRSGYVAGARMASTLEDIFADTADIANRPVEDGALDYTHVAFRNIIEILHDTAEMYREEWGIKQDGPLPFWRDVNRDPEPVAKLEEVRKIVADLRSKADARREELRAADPPGSGLDMYTESYRGSICRDLISEDMEKIRANYRARGVDPVFPPRPKPLDEHFRKCEGPIWSSAEIIAWARGNGPPDGYEVVKVGDDE